MPGEDMSLSIHAGMPALCAAHEALFGDPLPDPAPPARDDAPYARSPETGIVPIPTGAGYAPIPEAERLRQDGRDGTGAAIVDVDWDRRRPDPAPEPIARAFAGMAPDFPPSPSADPADDAPAPADREAAGAGEAPEGAEQISEVQPSGPAPAAEAGRRPARADGG
ncbi:hypothetical protein MASR1M32_10330 [Rhodobacter sp.]